MKRTSSNSLYVNAAAAFSTCCTNGWFAWGCVFIASLFLFVLSAYMRQWAANCCTNDRREPVLSLLDSNGGGTVVDGEIERF